MIDGRNDEASAGDTRARDGSRPGASAGGSGATGSVRHHGWVDWDARRPLIVSLAIAGLMTSTYLALFQLGLVARVWDPLFGRGSELVLRSAFARSLPVPDAVIGAIGYLVEAVLASMALRPGRSQLAVAAFGLVGIAMAATAILLVALQAFVVRAWCSPCLVSAVISIVVGLTALVELREAAADLAPDPERGTANTSAESGPG